MTVTSDRPAEPDQVPTTRLIERGRDLVRRGGRVVGLALLALLAFLVLRGMVTPYGYLSLDAGLLFAIGLVAAGVLLLRGREPVYEGVRARRAERPRSPLGILTLSAVFLVNGAMLLLSNVGVAAIGIDDMAPASLLVIGMGLLVGAWWGRSRFLIFVGLLTIPFVIASGFIHFPLRGSIGSRHVDARYIGVEDRYEILAGTMTLDLLRVKQFPAERTIDFEVAVGNVTIFVPQRLALSVQGDIEWGNANVGRGRQDGEDLRFENEFDAKPAAGHLTINFHGGIASLYVERISRREMYGPRKQVRQDRRGRDRAVEQRGRGRDGERRRDRG